jgi:hypothetical protein
MLQQAPRQTLQATCRAIVLPHINNMQLSLLTAVWLHCLQAPTERTVEQQHMGLLGEGQQPTGSRASGSSMHW